LGGGLIAAPGRSRKGDVQRISGVALAILA